MVFHGFPEDPTVLHILGSTCHCPHLEVTVATTLQSHTLERNTAVFSMAKEFGTTPGAPLEHRHILSAAEKPPEGNELGWLPC